MAKLAYGPASWHVWASGGAPVNPLHFYSTTYSAMHGREGVNRQAGNIRHRGTGYASNFRPAVFYSQRLDAVENPVMGKLLEDNYDSRTKKDYIQHPPPHSSDPFASNVKPFVSGFAHNLPRTLPTSGQVRGVHVNTAREPSIPVYPNHTSLLHTLKPKNPIAAENAGHGPKSMSTEYHTRFVRQQFRDDGLQSSRHSHKEKSGFTHCQNVEPVTFRPHENFSGELPGHVTWRPTGSSIMRQDFQSPRYMKGIEPFQSVTAKADRSNGYVKGNKDNADVQPKASEMVGYTRARQVHSNVLQRVKKEDPAEFSIMTHPHQYTSLTQRNFQGHQRSPPSESKRLERESVGCKELTGFSENKPLILDPKGTDAARFSTHYQQRFNNPNPAGSAREGHIITGGGVQPAVWNGFSKGTQVHRFGSNLDSIRTLRNMHPYVAKSVTKRDPYFDDHTHDAKMHSS